jgi:hypothetical protein
VRLPRVGDDRDAAAVRASVVGGGCDEHGVGLEADWCRRDELHAEPAPNAHQRVADVVPVTDVCEPESRKRAEPLAKCHRVRECLERMRLVRESVDDRDRGVLGELLDLLLMERADHEGGENAREDERHVAVRLAPSELELCGREKQGYASELGDSDLEGNARLRRRLVEDQADRSSGEKPELPSMRSLGLELVCTIEQRLELVARPRGDSSEVLVLQVRRHPRH